MKRIIYSALIVLSSVLALTSCTEESVTPRNDTGNNGGSIADPIK